jgi:hypothetical protein
VSTRPITFADAADVIAEQLIGIFRRNAGGVRPEFDENSLFQTDPHWKDLLLFYEYFNGEDGSGLGAAHQTGWTALVANLIKRKYEKASERRDRIKLAAA